MNFDLMNQKEQLNKRLAFYGFSAAALLLSSQESDAQIQYSGLQVLTLDEAGVLYDIDINNDNSPDFNMGLAWDSWIFNTYSTYSAFIKNASLSNAWIGKSNFALTLIQSYLISSQRSWLSDVHSYYNLGIAESNVFLGKGEKFIGIKMNRFDPEKYSLYGWIRVDINYNATKITVVDWALENSKNVPILAGAGINNLPGLSLLTNANEPIDAPFEVHFIFTEAVEEFTESDINISNGIIQAGSLKSVDNKHFTATIVAEKTGEVKIHVIPGAAQDLSGNPTLPSAQDLVVFADFDSPRVVLSTDANTLVTGPFNVTIDFSEDVTSFHQSDLNLLNCSVVEGTLVKFTNQRYEIRVEPIESGPIKIEIPEKSVQDNEFNLNLPSNVLKLDADLDSPYAIISTSAIEPVNSPFEVTIEFNEEVEGLDEYELEIENGFVRAGSLLTKDKQKYTLGVIPEATGPILISLPGRVVQNSSGFLN